MAEPTHAPHFLTADERRTLALICRALTDDPGVEQSGFVVDLETALIAALGEQDHDQFRLFLRLLEHATVNLLMAGVDAPFRWLSQPDRERVLYAWATSPLPLARAAFQGVKRLAMFLYYARMPNGVTNPAWERIGYAVPSPRERIPAEDSTPTIQPLAIAGDTVLTADVVVIGSGAGGGVVAAELAAAGADVLIVEKGEYIREGDAGGFHGRELDSMAALYEKAGALVTQDKAMMVLAGSTLGGGTTVNWAASLRTPDDVLHEWARDYGFAAANTAAYQASMDAVCARLGVNTHTPDNAQNEALARGAERLGLSPNPVPRNADMTRCLDDRGANSPRARCGFCNYGCPYGGKQGTTRTYLRDAVAHGARVIVRAYARRVLHERGQVVGVRLRVADGNGMEHSITVRAKIVVVAAGAIHTPALLVRSGVESAWIGANLRLHPTTAVFGLYDNNPDLRGWEGAAITRVVRDFANLDGAGYGVRLETAPIHPGIAALTMAWKNAAQHRRVLSRLNTMAGMIVIARDRSGGRVGVDRDGDPVLHYRLHPQDRAHLLRGVIEALRVAKAAGADEVTSPHMRSLSFREGGEFATFDDFLRRVVAEGLKPNGFALFSAHQMGTCRIAGSTALGACSPEGETYAVRGLFVADGSVLPTSTGVNPMISIMAAAHYLAQGIKARLRL